MLSKTVVRPATLSVRARLARPSQASFIISSNFQAPEKPTSSVASNTSSNDPNAAMKDSPVDPLNKNDPVARGGAKEPTAPFTVEEEAVPADPQGQKNIPADKE